MKRLILLMDEDLADLGVAVSADVQLALVPTGLYAEAPQEVVCPRPLAEKLVEVLRAGRVPPRR